jgi:very-short-patch-repair endonuclease
MTNYRPPRGFGETSSEDKRTCSSILRYADRLRKFQTSSERQFKKIAQALIKEEVWIGEVKAQHAFSVKWISDFFFPRIRLAVEIDGQSHERAEQIEKDTKKEFDAKVLYITSIRFRNSDVWDHPELVRKQLVAVAREAKQGLLKIKLLGQYSFLLASEG